MRKAAIALIVAGSLAMSACATTSGKPGVTLPTLGQLHDRYASAKRFAELLLPYVSPARAARIRLALDLVGAGLDELDKKATVTPADLRAADRKLERLDTAIDTP